MTKIITLEKGNDGVYAPTGEVEIKQDVIAEEKIQVFRVPEVPLRKKPIRRRKSKAVIDGNAIPSIEVHRFIASNGDKATEFLKGIQSSVNAFNLIKKLIK